MQNIFQILYYGFDLRTTGIIVGTALILLHVFALLKAPEIKSWLKRFPRNKTIGIAILFVDLLWAWIVISKMDMGEFHNIRTPLLVGLPIAFFLVVTYADEFLSVRALGAFLLLLACPILMSAFQKEPVSRVLLPTLAYAWILAGMFWVGMPYLLRDQIDWLSSGAQRWKVACGAGIVYGAATLGCALAFY